MRLSVAFGEPIEAFLCVVQLQVLPYDSSTCPCVLIHVPETSLQCLRRCSHEPHYAKQLSSCPLAPTESSVSMIGGPPTPNSETSCYLVGIQLVLTSMYGFMWTINVVIYMLPDSPTCSETLYQLPLLRYANLVLYFHTLAIGLIRLTRKAVLLPCVSLSRTQDPRSLW